MKLVRGVPLLLERHVHVRGYGNVPLYKHKTNSMVQTIATLIDETLMVMGAHLHVRMTDEEKAYLDAHFELTRECRGSSCRSIRSLRPWWRCCAGATPPLPACFLTGSSPPLPLRRSPRPHWSRSPCQACSRETDAAAASPLRSAPTHASGFLGDTMRLLWLPGQRTKLLRGRREIPE